MLQRFFQKYTGWLRSLKAVYVINNFLNADRLRRNRDLYRKFGLRKSIFMPVGHRDFAEKPAAEKPWLDQPDALEKLRQHADFQLFTKEIQEALIHFVENGYLTLPGFFPPDEVEKLNGEVAKLRAEGRANFNFTGRKIFNIHEFSLVSDQVFFKNERLLRLLEFMFGRPPVPFQTLHFIEGSEQRPHSDSIHMTTEPPGFLLAAWTALEPVDEQNGTLVFYPKSHRLPFVSTDDYDSGNTFLTVGNDSNRRYEDKIAQVLQENDLKPAFFHGQPGDVFIWHANLIHGGSPILKPGSSRRSMVAHYFAEGVICYHEMTQRPALI